MRELSNQTLTEFNRHGTIEATIKRIEGIDKLLELDPKAAVRPFMSPIRNIASGAALGTIMLTGAGAAAGIPVFQQAFGTAVGGIANAMLFGVPLPKKGQLKRKEIKKIAREGFDLLESKVTKDNFKKLVQEVYDKPLRS